MNDASLDKQTLSRPFTDTSGLVVLSLLNDEIAMTSVEGNTKYDKPAYHLR